MQSRLIIGTRGSPLALAQARETQARLAARWGVAEADLAEALPIEIIKTSGDRITDRALLEAGGKGLFTKELDEAMADGRIDLAVHSLKDVPALLPDGFVLAAFLEREDPRDAFICRKAQTLSDLPAGARIGTASARRAAQTLNARPDLEIVLLRGNVGTRLAKIEAGEADATYLAHAGLNRLGLAHEAACVMAVEEMLPAACQGVVAVQCREQDAAAREALAAIEHDDSALAAAAERAFLAALDGSCRTPLAALAERDGAQLRIRAAAYALDGASAWTRDETVALSADARADAAALGARLGRAIREEAGDRLETAP